MKRIPVIITEPNRTGWREL